MPRRASAWWISGCSLVMKVHAEAAPAVVT
jgi:hypothetical protein